MPRGRPSLAILAHRATADAHLERVAADWAAWATFWATYPVRTPQEAQIAAEGYRCYSALHAWQAAQGQPFSSSTPAGRLSSGRRDGRDCRTIH